MWIARPFCGLKAHPLPPEIPEPCVAIHEPDLYPIVLFGPSHRNAQREIQQMWVWTRPRSRSGRRPNGYPTSQFSIIFFQNLRKWKVTVPNRKLKVGHRSTIVTPCTPAPWKHIYIYIYIPTGIYIYTCICTSINAPHKHLWTPHKHLIYTS